MPQHTSTRYTSLAYGDTSTSISVSNMSGFKVAIPHQS